MSDSIEIKLSAARTKLILDRPFIGTLVLRLPMIDSTHWCKTTGTDARSFFYNREYIRALSLEQTQFMLAHDALHCALLHFSRRQHREKHRWDIACDFAVNALLIHDGLIPPPDVLHLKEYEGMMAEEIYPLISDQLDQEPLDQHLYDQTSNIDGGNSQVSSSGLDERNIQRQQRQNRQHAEEDKALSPDSQGGDQGLDKNPGAKENSGEDNLLPSLLKENEKEDLTLQWQQRVAGAAQTAAQAGKLSDGMARIVDHLMQPQLSWRALLVHYMTTVARDDYNFSRPSSRRDASGAIHPGLRSPQINLTVIVDTSGSITADEMGCFASEINAIKGQVRARVTLHACDVKMAENGPWVYEVWEEVAVPEDLQGGGGTDFYPAIEWVDSCGHRPDLLLYFTDAQGNFPEAEPPYPVLWLVKGKSPVPWGCRIQLN